MFQNPKDTPPPTRVETKEERLERRRREKAEQVAYKLEREIATWDPNNIESLTEDPFKTLFVARVVSVDNTHNRPRISMNYFIFRTTIHPSRSYVENSRRTDQLRRSSWLTMSTRESHEDIPSLSMNTNATCMVSCHGSSFLRGLLCFESVRRGLWCQKLNQNKSPKASLHHKSLSLKANRSGNNKRNQKFP